MKHDSIIILGYKRSGTSLLRVILNSHPDIAIGPEMKFMQSVVKNYPAGAEDFKKISAAAAKDFEFTEQTVEKIYTSSSTWNELMYKWCNEYKEQTGKKLWGDKTPQNFKYLKLLTEKFPNALYVHIVRNPFDVVRSSIQRGTYNGIQTIIAWLFSNINIKFVNRSNYMFVKYEQFVQQPEKFIADILERLELPNEDLLSVYTQKNHGRMAEGDSWNQPIIKEKKKKILIPFKDKLLIKLICFYYLKKYGYAESAAETIINLTS